MRFVSQTRPSRFDFILYSSLLSAFMYAFALATIMSVCAPCPSTTWAPSCKPHRNLALSVRAAGYGVNRVPCRSELFVPVIIAIILYTASTGPSPLPCSFIRSPVNLHLYLGNRRRLRAAWTLRLTSLNLSGISSLKDLVLHNGLDVLVKDLFFLSASDLNLSKALSRSSPHMS